MPDGASQSFGSEPAVSLPAPTDTAKTEQKRGLKRWMLSARNERDAWVSNKLGEQFRRSLLTEFRAIPAPDASDRVALDLYRRGLDLLREENFTWQNAYEAQQIKVHLLPETDLQVEIARALKQAHKHGIDTTDIVAMLEQPEEGTTADEKTAWLARLRVRLSHLVSDIQWEQQKGFIRRELRACYVRSICLATIGVGVLFFAALFWTVMMSDIDLRLSIYNAFGILDIDSTPDYFRFPGFFIAMASGVLGAWFSMLVSVDKRLSGLSLEELRVAQRSSSLIARLIFGAASAVIFYFLIRSNMIDGAILPDMEKVGFTQLAPTSAESVDPGGPGIDTLAGYLPSLDFCLLVVWCVIAGFSESFIPAALSRRGNQTDREGT